MLYKIIVILLFMVNAVNAQVNQQFTFDVNKAPAWSGTRHSYYTVTFNIHDIPAPNKPVKVDYSIEVIKECKDRAFSNGDWVFKLYYYDKTAWVSGDTLFTWPGPHDLGQTYTGSFNFMPLVSGNWDITIYYQGHDGYLLPSNYLDGISLQWCLDEDGEIYYLGQKRYDYKETCENAKVTYFSEDSVIFKLFPEQRGQGIYEYEIKITPIPKINDTCTIFFDLRPNKDVSEDCRMYLRTYGMTLPCPPDEFGPPFLNGQKALYSVKFVPMPFREEHRIDIFLSSNVEHADNNLTQTIGCSMIFDDNGNLKYFGRDLTGLPAEKYSSKLPEAGHEIKPIRVRIDLDQDKINKEWHIIQHLGGEND